VVEKLVKEVEEIKSQCDADLERAMPAYKKAQKALDTLKVDDIKEMKSYTKPAQAIVTLLKCVCMLNSRKETWEEAKAFMNAPKDFIDTLKYYPKEKMPNKLIKKLREYIDHPDLQVDMSTKSAAADSIHQWVKALYSFATVYKEVGPKMERQAKAEEDLKKVKGELKIKTDALALIQKELTDLRISHTDNSNKLQELKEQKQVNELRKGRAEQLLVGLADESERWKTSMSANEDKLTNVVGNIMLCAGYLSYLGPFTAQYREMLLKRWMQVTSDEKVPFSKDFTFESLLGDPVQIREWNNVFGLPADRFSVENGIITYQMVIPPTNSKGRWPLIIDPQGQANQWIRVSLTN
jgi:dynein heavy chain